MSRRRRGGAGTPLWLNAPAVINAATGKGFIWHRGDNVVLNGADVSTWVDIWNGRDLVQVTAANQALWDSTGLLGRPCLTFDGSQQHFYTYAATFPAGGRELYMVARKDADPAPATSAAGFYQYGSSGAGVLFVHTDGNVYDDWGSTTRVNTGNPTLNLASNSFLYNVVSSATEWTSYINGTQHYTTGTNTVGWSAAPNTVLGYSAGAAWFLFGRVAEMVIFDGELTASERRLMHLYFNARYSGLGVAV